MKKLFILLAITLSLKATSFDIKIGWNLVGFSDKVNLSAQTFDIPIINSEINATYSYTNDGIIIEWNNDTNSSYSLTLHNGSQQIYYGGHNSESATVNYDIFSLSGEETLLGHFTKYNNSDGSHIQSYSEFEIVLNRIDSFNNGDVKLVWKYKNNQWEAFSPVSEMKSEIEGLGITQFDSILPNEGIWILAENNFIVNESNNTNIQQLNIYKGWNLVSSPNSFSIDPDSINSTVIWKYINNQWKAYSKVYSLEEISNIEPNNGFWVLSDLDIGYVIDDNNITLNRVENRTAINTTDDHKLMSGDFTDSDNDGMTDVAELKYGYDPNNANSFPLEPPVITVPKQYISNSGIDAYIETLPVGINIKWENEEGSNYSLSLYNGEQQLYYGGHYSEYADVNYGKFNLNGDENLTGHFTKSDSETGQVIETMPGFTINLSDYSSSGNIGVSTNEHSQLKCNI